jgi:hypothetical protein
MLRQQVHIGDDYRTLIAKKDAEILVRYFYFNITKKSTICHLYFSCLETS